VLPATTEEAVSALGGIMLGNVFGDARREVVVEEFLEGEEFSVLSSSDGVGFRSLPTAQDHKRVGEDDQGPNTGGK